MKSWLSSKAEIRSTPAGKHLYAKQPIADNEQITRNGDDKTVMMTNDEFNEFAKEHVYKDALTLTGGFKKVTLSVNAADPSNFAAKASEPNAYNDGDGLVAIRDIAAGEAITV